MIAARDVRPGDFLEDEAGRRIYTVVAAEPHPYAVEPQDVGRALVALELEYPHRPGRTRRLERAGRLLPLTRKDTA